MQQQPYPMQGYGGQQQQSTVVIQQPMMMPGVVTMFRENPVRMTCPVCSADMMTSVSYETGTLAWVICFILCLVGLGGGCCLIPFCLDGCKDIVHQCPNCRTTVGKHNRM